MKIGDIVKLKPEHSLSELIQSKCMIDDISKWPLRSGHPNRYHIKTIEGELKMTWVYESEVDKISDIRDDILQQIGI